MCGCSRGVLGFDAYMHHVSKDEKYKDGSSRDFVRSTRLQRHLASYMMAAKAKVRSGGEACSAMNCSNSRYKCPGKSFFRFPKDQARCAN